MPSSTIAAKAAYNVELTIGGVMTQILGQYCINVRDIDKALEFWEGVCELPLQHRTEIPGVLEAVLQAEQGGSRPNILTMKIP